MGTLSAWSLSWTPVPTCILLSEPKEAQVKRMPPCAVEGNEKGSEARGSTQPLIFTSIIHLSMIFFFKVLFSYFVAGL